MPRNEHLPARTGCEISPKVGNFDRERLEHHLPKQAQTSAHRALPKRTEERRHEDRNSHRPFRSGTRVRCLRTQWVSELYADGTSARACGTVRHIFMAPAGLPIAAIVAALWIVSACRYRVLLSPLLQRRFGDVERGES